MNYYCKMLVLLLSWQLGGFRILNNTCAALYSNCSPSSRMHRWWIHRLVVQLMAALSFSIVRKGLNLVQAAQVNPAFMLILSLSWQNNTSASRLPQRLHQAGRVWSPDSSWLPLNKGEVNWGAWFQEHHLNYNTSSQCKWEQVMRMGWTTLQDLFLSMLGEEI